MAQNPNVSANDQIADEFTTHTLNILRVAADMQKPVLAELVRLEGTLAAEVAKLPDDPLSNKSARLSALLKQTRASIADAYTKIGATTQDGLAKIAAVEQKKTMAVVNKGIGASVMTVASTPEQLQSLASGILLTGRFPRQWWSKQDADLCAKFEAAMRDGIARGEGVDSLVRRVRGTKAANFSDGLMYVPKYQAAALVRTAVQTASNQARLLSFEANQDVIKGIQWRATLDDRTTEICMDLNGKQWSLPDYEPIDHDEPFPGPIAHWACRSTQTAVTYSWAELKAKKAVKPPDGPPTDIETLMRSELAEEGKTPEEIDQAVEKQSKIVTGEATPQEDINEFLNRKTPEFQNAALGPQRAQLFRENKIKVKDLLDQTDRPLSIAALNTMVDKGHSVPVPTFQEGQGGLGLAERSLLNESHVAGAQEGKVLSHFMDLTTGAHVEFEGTTPSPDDLAKIKGFGSLLYLRNGLSKGEIFTPQELNLFGSLPNFKGAKIVSPTGRVMAVNVKPDQAFTPEHALAVNVKLDATKNLTGKGNAEKLRDAVNSKDVPSVVYRDHGVGAIQPPPPPDLAAAKLAQKAAEAQAAKAVADKEKADADAQAAQKAKEQAEAVALEKQKQAEADAQAAKEAQEKTEQEAARQEEAQIVIDDAAKKGDPLSLAIQDLLADRDYQSGYQATELVAAAKEVVKQKALAKEAAAAAKVLADQQQAEQKAKAEAAQKLADEQAAAKKLADEQAAKLAKEKEEADKLAAEAKAKADAEQARQDAADQHINSHLAAGTPYLATALAEFSDPKLKLKPTEIVAAATAKATAQEAADLLAAQQAKDAADKAAAAKAAYDAEQAKIADDYKKASKNCVAAFGPGSPTNVAPINGIPFNTPPDEYWLQHKEVALADEPAIPKLPKGKEFSTGVLFVEDDGSVWLYQPTGKFGGYDNTFSKGRLEPNLTPQQNALKEAYEELGLTGTIEGYLGDFKRDTTMTRFYIGKRTGGEPWTAPANGETDYVKLATPDQAKKLFNKKTDQTVLAKLQDYLHPPAPGGPSALADLTFVKTLPGSTQPALMRDGKTGEEFVLKREPNNPGHVREEFYANEAYRAMGIAVPEQTLAEEADGPALLSKFIPGGKQYGEWLKTASVAQKDAMTAELQKGFVLDALLANYDVIGTGNDNILVKPDGSPVRLDNGGALRFRAQGAPKTSLGPKVTELDSMRDPKVNSYAGAVFKSITQAEIRSQIQAVVANRDAILAAMPADLRDLMGKRIDDLASRLPPGTAGTHAAPYTQADADKVQAAKVNGFTIAGDHDLFETTQQRFWRELTPGGDALTKAEVRLSVKGSEQVYKAIETSLKDTERTSAVGATLPVVGGAAPKSTPAAPQVDAYWPTVWSAIKTINTHVTDKKFNATTLSQAALKQAELENLKKTGTAEQKAMAAHYLPILEQVAVAAKAAKPTPFSPGLLPYTPPVAKTKKTAAAPAPAPGVPVVPGFAVKKVPVTFDEKRVLPDGTLQQTGAINFTQPDGQYSGASIAAYEIDVGGATLRFVPVQQGSKSSANGYAIQGKVEVTVQGEPTEATLGRIAAGFKALGIDNAPTSKEYTELNYLKRSFWGAKWEGDAKYLSIVGDTATSDAQKVDALKQLAKDKGVPASAFKGKDYNPAGEALNRELGTGSTVQYRLDYSREKAEKELAGLSLFHQSGTPYPLLIERLFASGAESTPTLERLRKGIPLKDANGRPIGMSPDADLNTGGSNFWFTRIRNKTNFNAAGLYFKIGNIARVDTLSYAHDWFGTLREDAKVAQRLTTTADYKKMGKHMTTYGDETDIRGGMNITEEIDVIKVSGKSDRQAIIDVFKKNGFAKLPDGRKIEDVVIAI